MDKYGEREQRYAIGHQFIRRSNRKRRDIETVSDLLVTRNLAGDMTSMLYVVTHDFMGQQLSDTVVQSTIDMGKCIKEMLTSKETI